MGYWYEKINKKEKGKNGNIKFIEKTADKYIKQNKDKYIAKGKATVAKFHRNDLPSK